MISALFTREKKHIFSFVVYLYQKNSPVSGPAKRPVIGLRQPSGKASGYQRAGEIAPWQSGRHLERMICI